MGQYWQVFNLDKHEALHGLGKLGESLPHGGFFQLRNHLKRFEATRNRTPKVSILVKNKHYDPQYRGNYSDLQQWCEWITERITQPLLPRSTLGVFQTFPNEILLMILQQMVEYVDIISFSLTNTNIYFLGYSVLQRRYCEDAADWEGDRIICFGDYCQWDDLPPGVFTKKELLDICARHGIRNEDDSVPTPNEGEETEAANSADDTTTIPQAMIDALKESDIWPNPYEYGGETFRAARENYGCEKANDLDKFDVKLGWNVRELMETDFKEYTYTLENPPLLCNISKRVYIRVLEVSKLQGRDLSWVSLLASKICWSSDPSISMALVEDEEESLHLHRGDWAGDRFARRLFSELDDLGGEGEWKDVTDEEVERIRRIWIGQYGEGGWESD
ncbi:hypothetical protein ABKN59_001720 [Abortiporus biennis]